MLSSPYPVSECLRRLAVVTTQRGRNSWFFDSHTVGRADPRFLGVASPSLISVTLWDEIPTSFTPWLEGRLEPAAGEGATLTGSVGMDGPVPVGFGIIVGGVICSGFLAGGAHLLASGDLGGLGFVLGGLCVPALVAAIGTSNARWLERRIPLLIEEMNKTLGSTAAFPSPDDVPASGDGA